MIRQLFKNRKAQNTAEYALLIALVIAGVIAMQTYAQRSLQARMRDAARYYAEQTNGIGKSVQYEPYYLKSDYDVQRNTASYKRQDNRTVAYDTSTNRVRGANGYENMTYDSSTTVGDTNTESIVNGI